MVTELRSRLAAGSETFATNDPFWLTKIGGPQVHRVLARMTDFVETGSGAPSHFLEYSQRGGAGYEIEHIWADHPEWHTGEFAHPTDFRDYRRRIGGLLLLPKRFNASFGDLPFAKKREHYLSQNLLARSLHEQAYDHSPGFRAFISNTGLPFQPHAEFQKADLDQRQDLYRQLAELIWNPDRLDEEAER